MNKKRNSVLWNVKDILASNRVTQMTLEEEGAYRRALDIFYLNGWLPYELADLSKAIGKNCTLNIAEKVRSMFKQDNRYVNSLTHDYIDKLPEGFEDELLVTSDADDTKKQMFVKCCEMLTQDEWIMRASPSCMTLQKPQFEMIVQEFMFYKLATGAYKNYRDSNEIRRNLLNFIPYSKIIKTNNQDGKPFANPKSATSKLEQW